MVPFACTNLHWYLLTIAHYLYCVQYIEPMAWVFKQLEQEWTPELGLTRISLDKHKGSHPEAQLKAGASPLLKLLQERPWLPTWAGFKSPQEAIPRALATHDQRSLQHVFAPLGPITVMFSEVRPCQQTGASCKDLRRCMQSISGWIGSSVRACSCNGLGFIDKSSHL